MAHADIEQVAKLTTAKELYKNNGLGRFHGQISTLILKQQVRQGDTGRRTQELITWILQQPTMNRPKGGPSMSRATQQQITEVTTSLGTCFIITL